MAKPGSAGRLERRIPEPTKATAHGIADRVRARLG